MLRPFGDAIFLVQLDHCLPLFFGRLVPIGASEPLRIDECVQGDLSLGIQQGAEPIPNYESSVVVVADEGTDGPNSSRAGGTRSKPC